MREQQRSRLALMLLLWPLAAGSLAAAGGTAAVRHIGASPEKWRRTNCGSPASMDGTTKVDIISEWGRQITVDNVKTIFAYPRPQMVRPSWHSLNGLWEFEACPEWGCGPAPFGRALNESILVPFPVESCLSGLRNRSNALNVPPTYPRMFYRTAFAVEGGGQGDAGSMLLHFGAVDWQCEVYVDGLWVGSHEGGFDGFSFDISRALRSAHRYRGGGGGGAGDGGGGGAGAGTHELIVQVLDPSNKGAQPFGKQRIEAMYAPGGDTYTPVSGIWQPVWLEAVPERYISALTLRASMSSLAITVHTSIPDGMPVHVEVSDGATIVASAQGLANLPFVVPIPAPRKLWSPESPFLYNLSVSTCRDAERCRDHLDGDTVTSYFGMREVTLCAVRGVQRPCINGEWRFLAGFLDQSYWPDGQYTAPGEAALVSDVAVLRDFGMNFIRLHQKVNPERWYYAADRLGILVAQDMPQHYGYPWIQGHINGNHSTARPHYYWHDLQAMIEGRGNHPCIFQWTLFNEAVRLLPPLRLPRFARDLTRALSTAGHGRTF